MTSMRWPTLWVAASALLLLSGCGPSSEDYSDAVMLCAEQYRRFDSGRWDNEYDIDPGLVRIYFESCKIRR